MVHVCFHCSQSTNTSCVLSSPSFYYSYRVVEMTGDIAPDMKAIASADLIVTTPEKWDEVSRFWQNRSYVQKVTLVTIDEIHLQGVKLITSY